MFLTNPAKGTMVSADQALKGRSKPIELTNKHYVLKTPLTPPYPDGSDKIVLGLGCFWGAEKAFWSLPGIITTAVGYSGGYTENATYEEVCTGLTGHNEVVLVVFDSAKTSLEKILKVFWESHNPTQGMRQGNDSGTQYRSGIYFFNDAQKTIAIETKDRYQKAIQQSGKTHLQITTEVIPAGEFYYAEDYHQQYLAKNPNGYCGLGGMGITCSINEID